MKKSTVSVIEPIEQQKLIGINPQTFYIILDKDWQQGNTSYYVGGIDHYEQESAPITIFNKIKRFLGVGSKKIVGSMGVYKSLKDGTIEDVK